MKKTLLLIAFALVCLFSFAQQKPKPKEKEKPPTQKEMEEMMKEMQKEMDDMSPEDKKMMDSMGIKMPSMKDMPKVTDKQLADAWEDENRIVPLKDASRIASISKTPLTNATMAAFISTARDKVALQLKPASKIKGEEIYKMVKTQYNSDVATGNTAAGLWMLGKAELALYVMGKACQDNPKNTDNLNNYASMLSMSGAEQLSIPVLVYVNKRFPKNSTVLNNIGQAWFGMGDIDKANSYLDSAIRLSATHPQANFTKSFIEESKGNQVAATEAAKRSIRKAYTQKKEDRLNKLGYKLKSNDLNWNRPMPADALGLEKFNWPAYPKSVDQSEALEKEWIAFKAKCNQEMEVLRGQQKKLETEMIDADQKRTKQLLEAGQKGIWVDPLPPFAPIAAIKLKYLIDGKDGHLATAYQQIGENLARNIIEMGQLESKLSEQLATIQKKYEDEFGEGKSNPFGAVCKDENSVKNTFLIAANGILEEANREYLNFLRKKLNDETYYYQYTQWPEQFELTKVAAKLGWLNSIRDQKVMFQNKSSACNEKTTEKESKPFKLAAFDDVNCKYHSELKTPVGTIKTDCSRMTTTLDLKVIKLGLKQDMDKETFGDQFMSCSVKVGVGASAGVNAGPLKAEASLGGSLGVEIDRNGISDVVVETSAGVSVGTDIISDGSMAGVGVSDLSLEVGVKGQVSLISGKSSIESTGLLQGAFKR
jgi:tetratricopeptide (TPR) repeat protein